MKIDLLALALSAASMVLPATATATLPPAAVAGGVALQSAAPEAAATQLASRKGKKHAPVKPGKRKPAKKAATSK
jgi:hypothetical protein